LFCVQRHVIGLARDLRGIAFAFNTKVSYMMLFDWLYPLVLFRRHLSVSLMNIRCVWSPLLGIRSNIVKELLT